jgi:thiosulfate/3-mercaptopyruvate sulfurtransferase
MKNTILYIVVLAVLGASVGAGKSAEANRNIGKMLVSQEPWTEEQLMPPAELAAVIKNPAVKKPVIICIGPGALIKGSINTGPAKEKENLEKLRKELDRLPKDSDIVIYCGCCPFDHCPNIRPAFKLLNEMKFTNSHLLNIEHNIRTDWVDKGYPQEKS